MIASNALKAPSRARVPCKPRVLSAKVLAKLAPIIEEGKRRKTAEAEKRKSTVAQRQGFQRLRRRTLRGIEALSQDLRAIVAGVGELPAVETLLPALGAAAEEIASVSVRRATTRNYAKGWIVRAVNVMVARVGLRGEATPAAAKALTEVFGESSVDEAVMSRDRQSQRRGTARLVLLAKRLGLPTVELGPSEQPSGQGLFLAPLPDDPLRRRREATERASIGRLVERYERRGSFDASHRPKKVAGHRRKKVSRLA